MSLQLQWLDQFQFAGYYVAKEKGFYRDVGLDVELLQFDNTISTVESVLSSKATYGIGRSSLIIDRSNGKEIVLLASAFQSSPSVLIATKQSNIKTVLDFVGKRIMMTNDAVSSVAIQAMMNSNGVLTNKTIKQKHSFDVDDLINQKTDLMASYISNEPFLLNEKGIEYTIFDPKSYGFDFYSDILFTSANEIKNHRQRAISFTEASVRGWIYAFDHIDETVELILKKYNVQNKSKAALKFEAEALKKLAYYNNEEFGHIDKVKIEKIHDYYHVMGWLKDEIDIDAFIQHEHRSKLYFLLSKKEQEYLKDNKIITFTNLPNWLPFEGVDKNNNYLGIVADHLGLVESALGIEFQKIISRSWNESLDIAMNEKATVISGDISDTVLNEKFNPIESYVKNPIVIIMKHSADYVDKLNEIANKKIAVIKNHVYTDEVYEQRPNIQFIEVDNIENGLLGIEIGKYDAMLAPLAMASYNITKMSLEDISIVGKTDLIMQLTLFVNKKEPLLHSILNKAMKNISDTQHQNILTKWRHTNNITKIDYTLIWKIFAFMALVLAFIIYRYHIIKEHNKQLQELSTHDALTKLYNRRYLDTKMNALLSLAKRYETPFSIILIDIDDFKLVNDLHGHDEGDTVLKKIAAILSENSRSTDIAGRWGGEEFLIICEHSGLQAAIATAQKMCQKIEEKVLVHTKHVTASFGVHEYSQNDTMHTMIIKADKALYRAKKEGKNRVSAYQD
ncbi:diguanylate cyclase [bacterium]|nr:diguanylate cyclase [bacterium]MBU1991270.1 diguanylate cyclase [bacterium]